VELHTTDPLKPESSPFVPDISIAKLKKYNSFGIDQILAELLQAAGETIIRIYNGAVQLTVVIIESYHCYQLHTIYYAISFSEC
jgi:hypothetical protein